MPRSTIANRRFELLDVDIELRPIADAAISASTNGVAVELKAELLHGYKAVVYWADYTGYVATTAEWTVKVEASTDMAFTTPIVVSQDLALPVVAGEENKLYLPLEGQAIAQLNTSADRICYLRTVATEVGAPGDLTYGNYLTLLMASGMT